MIIELYLYDKFDKTALDILKLLDKLELQFSVQSFSKNKSLDEISIETGETVRRLPLVFIDGKKVDVIMILWSC